MSKRARLWHALALFGGFLIARTSRADTEPIRIEYQASAGCPNARDFVAEVFKRTKSARLVEADARVRTFVVQIEQRRTLVTGSLRVREGQNETVAREVQGERCSEVASALALATALAIDPNASLSTTAATPGSGDTSGEGDRNASGAGDPTNQANPGGATNSNSKPPNDTSAGQLNSDATTEDRVDSGAGPSAGKRYWALALGPSLALAITPRAALGGSLAAEWHDITRGSWLSSYGVDLTLVRALTHETQGAHSSFQIVHARPAVCSYRLGSGPGLSLSPCLGVELGAVSGWGSDIASARSDTRFWAALDLLLRARAAAASGLFAQLEGGAVLPFTRYDFVFLEPSTPVHSVPAVAFTAGLRIGVELWR
ncbi:MAG: hypothetical protein ACOY0T_13225 [Myxococcota bacterium]